MAKTASKNGAANRIPLESGVLGVTIEPPKMQVIRIPIVGKTPLIVHAWSKKAITMMEDKQQGKSHKAREHKNPEQDVLESRYISKEGWDGIPASGFKACMVNACRGVDGFPMTEAKRFFFVISQGNSELDGTDLVRIHGKHQPYRSMVRLETKVADIRYRAIYPEWKMDIEVEFLASKISPEQVVNLVSLAGEIEGLCEWRPGAPKSNSGNYGRFTVDAVSL